MIRLIRLLFALLAVCAPFACAHAEDRPARSITIPISVMLTPDYHTTYTAAVDCGSVVRSAPNNVEVCKTQHQVMYASRRNGSVLVTVMPI